MAPCWQSAGAPLNNPADLSLTPSGQLIVGDVGAKKVFQVNPRTGSVVQIASSPTSLGNLHAPEGVTVEPPLCRGRTATIVGSTGRDRLVGSRFADVIVGLNGKDRIVGQAGRDLICGGKGNDSIRGNNGNDLLFGEAGRDTLIGSTSKDTCVGGKSAGRIVCEKGAP